MFLFQSLMAASKNEILMGMAQYAQRQRNIVIRCIEEDDVYDRLLRTPAHQRPPWTEYR